jgi:TolB protein
MLSKTSGLVLSFLVGLLVSTGSASGPGRIAFASTLDGDLHWIAPDGSAAHRLARGVDPAWSPDGRKLVFVRAHDLYVMDADGSHVRRLTRDRRSASPAWSPDGKTIAFVRGTGINVFRLGGGPARRITNPGGQDRSPAWSPDGRTIVFARFSEALEHTIGDNYELWTVRPDGSRGTRLTLNFLDDEEPAWSPDGRLIAFTRYGDVWTMRRDGKGARRLTRGPANDREPAWSPDSRRIAFVSDRAGADALYVMSTDGSGRRRIPHTEGAADPAWAR